MDCIDNKKFKILIVDDVPKNIQVLGTILSKNNFQTSYADSGEKTLQLVEYNNFDLILLDIMMPGMDGFEVCRRLKSNPKTSHIPVIFLTAKTESESIARGFEIGGQDYITKPFQNKELIARVRTHVSLKRRNEEVEEKSRALEEINQMLNEANAAKDKFFSIIAHDLKNPFGDITGLSELLIKNMRRYDITKIEKFIEQIHKLSKNGYTLLENLLEWSRSQTGNIECHQRELNLKEQVDDVILLLEEFANKKAITLTNHIASDLMVRADKNMLDTIIRNLISNAIKFTANDGKIALNANEITDEHGTAMIQTSIADSGVGIASDDLDKLFRIDVNHSTIGTSKEKGTGLGLILCKEFVEKNGGTIWVDSQIEKGTTFYFTLKKVAGSPM